MIDAATATATATATTTTTTDNAVTPIRGDAIRSIDPDGWYSVVQVADLLQVSRMTVVRWINSRKLRAERRMGLHWFVLGSSVIASAPGIHSTPPMARVETPNQRTRRVADAMKRIGRSATK